MTPLGESSYLNDIREIMKIYGFNVIGAPRTFWAFRPDIVAEDKRTKSPIIVEIKANTPILTNVVQALAYYKKKIPRGYFIAFSPLGTYPDVKEVADREGIWIVSSLEQLRDVLSQVTDHARESPR